MTTIIEIEYKNYKENIIINESNFYNFLDLLFSDKFIIDFKVIQQGVFSIQNELGKSDVIFTYTIPNKVKTVLKLEEKIASIENSSFGTDKGFRADQKRKEKFKNSYNSKLKNLTNIQKLFI